MTRQEAIAEARKILKEKGIKTICLDILKGYPAEMDGKQYQDCVNALVDDTLYWDG
jgi:hypothetical protein